MEKNIDQKNYKIKKGFIIEISTEQCIYRISKRRNLRKKILQNLNSGCGFNGFTPKFIVFRPINKDG